MYGTTKEPRDCQVNVWLQNENFCCCDLRWKFKFHKFEINVYQFVYEKNVSSI